MISPYVRRRRLAAELRALREQDDCPADKLAEQIGVARQTISRLENGHVAPDLHVVMKILRRFGVGEDRWQQVMTIARDARERGWWATFATQMGARQALYADLEAGADAIREYRLTMLPGLLQIPTYTEARLYAGGDTHPGLDPTRVVEARTCRQQMLECPGGPVYEVILDELVVRRHAVPAHVAGPQLDHLVDLGHHHDNVTIRVLPVRATITGVPRSAFSCYTYPDPGDPTVVAVDTITSDLVLTTLDKPADVASYIDLYEHLRAAALSPADSLDLLASLAEKHTQGGTTQ
ncbi:MAG: helix-turn-helix domain-containing protein [Natronosporangium sp.]